MTSKRIVGSPRGTWVEQRPNRWCTAGAIILGVGWLVLCIPLMTYGDKWAGFIVTTAIFTWPLVGVLGFFGSRRRHRIQAMLDARQVPGGVHVTVMDVKQRRHELVTTLDVAAGLANTLASA